MLGAPIASSLMAICLTHSAPHLAGDHVSNGLSTRLVVAPCETLGHVL